jgi:methylase of polypeptide subunit release factors
VNITNNAQANSHQHHLSLLLVYLQLHEYRFTTISPASHAQVNSRIENAEANDLIGIFGWNRPFKRDLIDDKLFDLMQAADIAVRVGRLWKSRLRVSSMNGLLFLHSAFPTVENEAVFFGPDSYRFANVIHQFFASHPPPIHRAVDIGTGSGLGAILLALALKDPEANPDIIAVDINEYALNLASVNMSDADIHHIQLVNSNLLSSVGGNFDLIIANPPYLIDKSERTYRHGGGHLGADLSLAIVATAIERLNPGGTLLLYTGIAIVNGHDAFLAEATERLILAGFTLTYSEIDPDIFGEELESEAYSSADRIAAVVLTARKLAQKSRIVHFKPSIKKQVFINTTAAR